MHVSDAFVARTFAIKERETVGSDVRSGVQLRIGLYMGFHASAFVGMSKSRAA